MDEQQQEERGISLKEFFESVPPGRTVAVESVLIAPSNPKEWHSIRFPQIRLHCDAQACNGDRLFEAPARSVHSALELQLIFVTVVATSLAPPGLHEDTELL